MSTERAPSGTTPDPDALRGVTGLLSNKVAIVTGAGSGIGRATARLFARQGAAVALVDVDGAKTATVAARIDADGGRAIAVPCDVAVESEVVAAVQATVHRFGGVDVLFNNAGIEQPVTPSHEVDADLFTHVLQVNLAGTFHFCKHVVPHLLERGGGTIVNNSSVSAFANVGGNVSYAASKGAVMSLTRVLAIEYARRGIRVNAINPGVIDTAMNERNLSEADDPETIRARWADATPLGRMATPDEIAWTVTYLASPLSTFTTGVGLLIDGGRVAT